MEFLFLFFRLEVSQLSFLLHLFSVSGGRAEGSSSQGSRGHQGG